MTLDARNHSPFGECSRKKKSGPEQIIKIKYFLEEKTVQKCFRNDPCGRKKRFKNVFVMVRAGRNNASKMFSLWSARAEKTKNCLRNRSAQKFENCNLRNRNTQLFDVAKSQRSIIVTLPINVTLSLSFMDRYC